MGNVKKKTLIFVGPLPPPILGESIALQSLYEAEKLHEIFDVKKMNLSRKDFENPGGLAMDKLFFDSIKLAYTAFLSVFNKNAILYISISQTKMGLIRDCLFIRFAKVSNRNRVVAHLHGNNLGGTIDATSGRLRKFIENTLKKVDVGIVLGGKLAPNFKNLVKRIEVVSNGIPEHFIRKNEINFNRKKERLSILYLSNLMAEKGYVELIHAVVGLIKEGLDLELNLVGAIQSENEFQEVKRFIDKNGMADRIIYHGTKRGEEKKRFFLEADMMALPTKYKVEGQPMSIIEGMAAGLPIISSDRGIIAELIEDCGILVEPAVADIKQAIRRLAVNEDERKLLGKISREIYEEYYTEDKYTDSLIAIFNEFDNQEAPISVNSLG
ncbi:GDP-mannose-dependent alpha-(1-6)-phosphatidylinositol monomannoside mannosyltransferase [Planococcus massiliensis]|uniref:GDP-mannose-dependent alpha-(1-6)-phosphatidylinositol monomannoside mannosyltransferase n=1 Tax=Planococcus massiliensis TaxID=1499687 RepID=A0A098EJW3_9BACL|nr:glycosyltransferase family 4 protein [Planococcus massiliensis]CEG22115.1 GDP-mannose-dependent alpha-(1-6)-phosphatidylinositol monomannoside mannosyltransferase [Planococcus massiliensis]